MTCKVESLKQTLHVGRCTNIHYENVAEQTVFNVKHWKIMGKSLVFCIKSCSMTWLSSFADIAHAEVWLLLCLNTLGSIATGLFTGRVHHCKDKRYFLRGSFSLRMSLLDIIFTKLICMMQKKCWLFLTYFLQWLTSFKINCCIFFATFLDQYSPPWGTSFFNGPSSLGICITFARFPH